jgi:hypothetical protein
MKRSLLIAVLSVGSLIGPAARAAAADFTITPSGMSAWTVNAQANPGLTLVRGHSYTFAVNAPGHPFWIKSMPGTGTNDSFDMGAANNGLSAGTLTFVVPASAPSTLYYQCQFHEPMVGLLTIVSAPPAVPATTGLTRGALAFGLASVGLALFARRRLRQRSDVSGNRRLFEAGVPGAAARNAR